MVNMCNINKKDTRIAALYSKSLQRFTGIVASDRLQILLLVLIEFKQINSIPPEITKTCSFSAEESQKD